MMYTEKKTRSGSGMTAEELAKAFSSPATKNAEQAKEYILSFANNNKKSR